VVVVEVSKEVLVAILNAAQDGAEPCVPFSRDQGEFAKRAAALSMTKCGQVAKMAESLLLGVPVEIPQPDTADGELV